MIITKKEFNGFKKAYFKGISFNDAYNLDYYGITQKRFFEIKKASVDIVGILNSLKNVTYSQLKKY